MIYRLLSYDDWNVGVRVEGEEFDVTETPMRLDSVTIRAGEIIYYSFGFSYTLIKLVRSTL
jgi:hypothetical protein